MGIRLSLGSTLFTLWACPLFALHQVLIAITTSCCLALFNAMLPVSETHYLPCFGGGIPSYFHLSSSYTVAFPFVLTGAFFLALHHGASGTGMTGKNIIIITIIM
jgi:hypothetical protein